ncbi:MAG: hypothetical protein EU539_13280 [Promethearchaeota archaeon]|nr:MAG: hypothetical protein EU539_13280 [Candidatus Lokiarchaeota archaeon]
MSEQIDRLFSKFKDVFKGKEEEIKKYLIKYNKSHFEDHIVEDIERIDATEKIKTSGFRSNISGWNDARGDIFVSSCLEIGGKQVRYDYKIIFYKSKFLSEDIEKIKKALDEINTLRENLHFKVAVIRLDSAIKLANEIHVPKYMKELRNIEKEIETIEDHYNAQLDELGNSIARHREMKNIEAALSDCKKVIQISESIDRNELLEKYKNATENIMNEMIADKEKRESIHDEIVQLDAQLTLNRDENQINDAIKNCEKILELSRSIENDEIFKKYDSILSDLKKQKLTLQETEKKLKTDLKELDEKIKIYLEKEQLNDALEASDKSVQISKELNNDDLVKKYTFISERIIQRINEKEWKIEAEEKSKRELEELKRVVEQLNKEGLEALNEHKLEESLKKYKEIKKKLLKYT